MTGPDFASLLQLAENNARERRSSVAAVLKELLHYEILQAMLETDALQTLTFQGGTALRLCYGGDRYSEDLDFVCGASFDPGVLDGLAEALSDRIGRFYGLGVTLDVRVPEPGSGVEVGRWRAKVWLPQLDRSQRQAYVINIEVAAVPAHTRRLLRVQGSFRELPSSYGALLVPTESIEEIAADKVVAFGARRHLKHRDVWDLWSLNSRGVSAPTDLVRLKLEDYGLDSDRFAAGIAERLEEIGDPGYLEVFLREMERFLDQGAFAVLSGEMAAASVVSASAALVETAITAVRRDL